MRTAARRLPLKLQRCSWKYGYKMLIPSTNLPTVADNWLMADSYRQVPSKWGLLSSVSRQTTQSHLLWARRTTPCTFYRVPSTQIPTMTTGGSHHLPSNWAAPKWISKHSWRPFLILECTSLVMWKPLTSHKQSYSWHKTSPCARALHTQWRKPTWCNSGLFQKRPRCKTLKTGSTLSLQSLSYLLLLEYTSKTSSKKASKKESLRPVFKEKAII